MCMCDSPTAPLWSAVPNHKTTSMWMRRELSLNRKPSSLLSVNTDRHQPWKLLAPLHPSLPHRSWQTSLPCLFMKTTQQGIVLWPYATASNMGVKFGHEKSCREWAVAQMTSCSLVTSRSPLSALNAFPSTLLPGTFRQSIFCHWSKIRFNPSIRYLGKAE